MARSDEFTEAEIEERRAELRAVTPASITATARHELRLIATIDSLRSRLSEVEAANARCRKSFDETRHRVASRLGLDIRTSWNNIEAHCRSLSSERDTLSAAYEALRAFAERTQTYAVPGWLRAAGQRILSTPPPTHLLELTEEVARLRSRLSEVEGERDRARRAADAEHDMAIDAHNRSVDAHLRAREAEAERDTLSAAYEALRGAARGVLRYFDKWPSFVPSPSATDDAEKALASLSAALSTPSPTHLLEPDEGD